MTTGWRAGGVRWGLVLAVAATGRLWGLGYFYVHNGTGVPVNISNHAYGPGYGTACAPLLPGLWLAPGETWIGGSSFGPGTPAGYGNYVMCYAQGGTPTCASGPVEANGDCHAECVTGLAQTYTTNWWANVSLVNTSSLAQTYAFYLTGTNGVTTCVATKDVAPFAPVTWTITNSSPFTFAWVAGIPGDGGTAGSVTGSPMTVTLATNYSATVYGAMPPDLTSNLVVVPPAAGLTNNSADQNTRAGFNGLLVQGSAAALQDHKDLTALKASVDQVGSNVVAVGAAVSGLSSNLTAGADASNLVYGVTGDAWGTNFGFGWTNTLRSWLPSVAYGQTRPVVQVPLGSLGVAGLADVPLDFGAAAFASWVGPLRAFLLFLVSVSFLLAAFKIARWLAPS